MFEEILDAYNAAKQSAIDSEQLIYNNMVLQFVAGKLLIWEAGDMEPFGRYKMPPDKDRLFGLLQKLEINIKKAIDDNQYLCNKCLRLHERPAFTTDKNNAPTCETCANGGDERTKEDKAKDKDASKNPEVNMSRIEQSIRYLQEQGYVVKRVKQSYKAVYLDAQGNAQISSNYYKTKEDFEQNNEGRKFINFVKELAETEEERLT